MIDTPELRDELLSLASQLAVETGRLVETMRAQLGTGDTDTSAVQTKSSPVDIVTAADRAAENAIIDGIVSRRPDDAVLAEEGGDRPGRSGVRWLIDPIDGTTNYVYDLPAYSVSIAAEIDGTVVAGAVYEPRGETLYSAVLGRGARRNGQPISCSDKSDLASALVATGFGYVVDRRRGQAEVLLELLPRVRDIRRFGSAALDLCLLACGQVDAYYERGLNPWDLAAGTLVAAEAGAVLGDLRGGPPDTTFVLGAAPPLFPLIRNVLIGQNADKHP